MTYTTNQFINLAKLKHNNYYSYEKFTYINSKTKGIITCPIHGEFYQNGSNHLMGKGCPKCAIAKNNHSKKIPFDVFVDRSYKIHGKYYDYQISRVHYEDLNSMISILCPIHGKFEQLAAAHSRGHGCKQCTRNIKRIQKNYLNYENFSHLIFGTLYLIQITDEKYKKIYYKIGVTSRTVKLRFRDEKNISINIICEYNDNIHNLYLRENYILTNVISNLSRPEKLTMSLVGGYSECFYANQEEITYIKHFYND